MKPKTLGRLAVLMLLGTLVGVRVYNWNARTLAGNAVPMPLGVGASVVLSGSMEPALSAGDLLVFAEAESYTVGDIVVYQSGSTPVVHRIVEENGDTVITQGDANNIADQPISRQAVKGKVLWAIPLAGYAVWALKSPVVTVLLILAAVALVEGSFRREKIRADQQQEKIKEEIRQLMKELEQ